MTVIYILICAIAILCSMVIFGLLYIYKEVEELKEAFQEDKKVFGVRADDLRDKLDILSAAVDSLHKKTLISEGDVNKMVDALNNHLRVFTEGEIKNKKRSKKKDISEE